MSHKDDYDKTENEAVYENNLELVHMNLKDRLTHHMHNEKTKLKPLNTTEKILYILDYYKFSIIVCLAVLSFFIFSIGKVPKGSTFYFIAVNDSQTREFSDFIEQDFSRFLNINNKKRAVYADSELSIVFDAYGRLIDSDTHFIKLTALVANKQADVIVGSPETIDFCNDHAGLVNLDEWLPKDVYDQVKPYIYTITDSEDNICEIGLDISRSTVIAGHLPDYEPVILTIPKTTKKQETVLQFIQYLYGDH